MKLFPIDIAAKMNRFTAKLAIAAWNALDYLDDRAKSVSDQLRAISPRPNNPPNRAGDYSIPLKNKTMADLRR